VARINQFGLSDDIPDPIRREIRQRCGFGCVICGSAIYEYEHVDPVFADAKIHEPDCITLLCSNHHALVTKGLLSKESVKEAGARPKCKESGFSFGPFDIGRGPPEIVLGTITARNAKTLIRIKGDNVFWIAAPTEAGRPFLLNARFFDTDGTTILDIVENEWHSSSENWDVEVVGARITIRKRLGDLSLVLRSEPSHRLVVERMNMIHRGIRIICNETQFRAISPDGSTFAAMGGIESDDWLVGIDVDERSVKVGRGGTMVLRAGTSGAPKPWPGTRRNAPCPCGSGLKYKRCHGS
jgi:hypothetical protein